MCTHKPPVKNLKSASREDPRSGVTRPTAVRIEAGDPGRTLGQLLRYLHAIAPRVTLLQLMRESDPSLIALSEAEMTKRVRRLSDKQLKALDF